MLKSFRTALVLIIVVYSSLPVILSSSLLVKKIYTITHDAAYKELRLTAKGIADFIEHETALIIARLVIRGSNRHMALATRNSTLEVQRYLNAQAFEKMKGFISANPLVSSLYLINGEFETALAAPSSLMDLPPSPIMREVKKLFSEEANVTPEYRVVEFKDVDFLRKTRQAVSEKKDGSPDSERLYGIAILVPVVVDGTNEKKGVLAAVIPLEKLAIRAFSMVERPTMPAFFREEELVFPSRDKMLSSRRDSISDRVMFQIKNPENKHNVKYEIQILEPLAVRFAGVQKTVRVLLFYIIGALTLLIVFSFAVAVRLAAPLDSLVQLVNAYAEGNYHVDSPRMKFFEFQNVVVVLAKMGKKILSQISELKKAEEKYRAIFENAVEGIFQVTREGAFISTNPSFARILGCDSPETPISSVTDIAEQIDISPAALEAIRRTLEEDKRIIGFECRLYRDRGTPAWVSASARTVRDADGNILFFEGSLVDVTERKERERAEKERKAADAANQAKSEFLANMSHEIRTPMNGVVGMTELLLMTELTAAQKDYADAISGSANSLLTILNDILDFSKIQAGKLELESTRFCLRDVVEQICHLFAGQAKDKQIEILVRYSMDAPSHVIGDSTRIRQILNNLVGNAFKFTEQGHVLVDVACEKKDEDHGDFIFNISDTGVGIPEDRQQGIFDKFSQADESTTRRFGGTGLGLAICKQLVELMGGEIGVVSEVGKGATFHFQLAFPCMDKPVLDEKAKAELSEVSVLVVDDNEINRTIAREYLGSWNIPCEGVVSAGKALERLRQAVQENHPFKIAIIDYFMPEMNGGGLADAIKADKEISDTLLILLSSGVIARELRASTRAHFAASMSKPIRASHFLNTLMDAWRRYRNGEPDQTDQTDQEAPDPESETTARVLRTAVLLVEDNHMNQRVAAGILRRFGCRVDVAGNGEEAVNRYREKAFDMIFMDAHMPVMDGFQATREIRKREESGTRTPIVAMTALAMEGDRERCLEAGMDDYIAKPIKSKNIFDALLKYRSRRPGEDEAAPEEPDEIEVSDKPVLNPSQLLDVGGHDEELIRDLIDEFIKDAPVLLDILRDEIDAGDQNRIAIKAHQLNGMAANSGGERFLEMGLAIENTAREGAFEPNERKLSLLATELDRLKRALVETDWAQLCN